MNGHVHNEVLLEIIMLKALEHTIANSSILLVTSIPIHCRSHCITPNEERKHERQQGTNKFFMTQSVHVL